jgi:hypothetical protein
MPGLMSMYENSAPTFDMGGIDQRNYNPILAGSMQPISQMINNNPTDAGLRDQMTAANVGNLSHGVNALLGRGYQPYWNEIGGAEGETNFRTNLEPAKNLASLFNIDPGKYDLTGRQGASSFINDLNTATNPYYSVSGLSRSWAPNPNDARQAATTLYQQNPQGQLQQAAPSSFYSAPRTGGFLRQNADEISGILSAVLPAFGGWAGLLGQGASGTLTAGGGLGLTGGLSSAVGNTATNALVNAGMGSLLSGNGTQGFLSSLASGGLNSALGSGIGNLGLGSNVTDLLRGGLNAYNSTAGRAGLSSMFR